jgi:Ca-activated chloride channel family protein
MPYRRATLVTVFLLLAGLQPRFARGQSDQPDQPVATFKSSVDLVSVTAVVRDKKGRVVRTLTANDLVVTEGGNPRAIVGMQADDQAPASIALLVDGSGSMRLGTATVSSQQICALILANLHRDRDLAALMSFDTRLLTLREFTQEFDQIRSGLGEVEAFGSTSIYDAIAGTAAAVANRTQNRRAVVVITDGADNASTYSPEEVAWIASTIDVPVYVFAVGELNPLPSSGGQSGPEQRNALFELARATGGDYFFASSPSLVSQSTNRLLDELRHQYLIAFEPSTSTGLRRIEIRARNNDFKVRSRKWYSAGGD